MIYLLLASILTDPFIFTVQLDPGQMFPILYILYFPSLIPLHVATSQQCEPSQQSESGKALKGHIFKSKKIQDPYKSFLCSIGESKPYRVKKLMPLAHGISQDVPFRACVSLTFNETKHIRRNLIAFKKLFNMSTFKHSSLKLWSVG